MYVCMYVYQIGENASLSALCSYQKVQETNRERQLVMVFLSLVLQLHILGPWFAATTLYGASPQIQAFYLQYLRAANCSSQNQQSETSQIDGPNTISGSSNQDNIHRLHKRLASFYYPATSNNNNKPHLLYDSLCHESVTVVVSI